MTAGPSASSPTISMRHMPHCTRRRYSYAQRLYPRSAETMKRHPISSGQAPAPQQCGYLSRLSDPLASYNNLISLSHTSLLRRTGTSQWENQSPIAFHRCSGRMSRFQRRVSHETAKERPITDIVVTENLTGSSIQVAALFASSGPSLPLVICVLESQS